MLEEEKLQSIKVKFPFQFPHSLVNQEDVGAAVIFGPKLDAFTDEDWIQVLSKNEIVFARTTPQQKKDIVERCQKVVHSSLVIYVDGRYSSCNW